VGDKLTDIPKAKATRKTTSKKQSRGVTKVKPLSAPAATDEQIQDIINRIENGQSERSACAEVGVSRSTFRTTALRHQAGDHYARALFGLAQDQVEKIEATIEDMRMGTIDSNMARVEIDTRKWFASKFLPKTYGDKLDVTSDGEKVVPILGIIPTQNETKQVEAKNVIDL
jgi:hypothetical protein